MAEKVKSAAFAGEKTGSHSILRHILKYVQKYFSQI